MSAEWDDRTIAPTPRRREEALARGDLPRSGSLGTAAVVLAVCIYGMASGGAILWEAAEMLRQRLAGPVVASRGDLVSCVQESLWAGLALGGGVILAAFAAIVGADVVQRGVRINPSRPLPEADRVLVHGAGRMAAGLSLTGLVGEVLRWITPLGLLACLVVARWPEVAALVHDDPVHMTAEAGGLAVWLATRIGLALAAVGIVQYAWSRWRWEKSLMMTPDEQREEQRLLSRRRA